MVKLLNSAQRVVTNLAPVVAAGLTFVDVGNVFADASLTLSPPGTRGGASPREASQIDGSNGSSSSETGDGKVGGSERPERRAVKHPPNGGARGAGGEVQQEDKNRPVASLQNDGSGRRVALHAPLDEDGRIPFAQYVGQDSIDANLTTSFKMGTGMADPLASLWGVAGTSLTVSPATPEVKNYLNTLAWDILLQGLQNADALNTFPQERKISVIIAGSGFGAGHGRSTPDTYLTLPIGQAGVAYRGLLVCEATGKAYDAEYSLVKSRIDVGLPRYRLSLKIHGRGLEFFGASAVYLSAVVTNPHVDQSYLPRVFPVKAKGEVPVVAFNTSGVRTLASHLGNPPEQVFPVYTEIRRYGAPKVDLPANVSLVGGKLKVESLAYDGIAASGAMVLYESKDLNKWVLTSIEPKEQASGTLAFTVPLNDRQQFFKIVFMRKSIALTE